MRNLERELDERERYIIQHRGQDEHRQSRAVIAKHLGITQSRVAQLEQRARAILKLRPMEVWT